MNVRIALLRKLRRIDAFDLWFWRRLLRVPWTAGISSQSIIKGNQSWIIHWKDWCSSWNSSALAIWCKELIHWLEKTLMVGKTEVKRRGQQRIRWLDGIPDSMYMSLSKLWLYAWHAAVHGITKSWTGLSNWNESI